MSKIVNKPKPYFKYNGKTFVNKFIPFANIVWCKEDSDRYLIYMSNKDSLAIEKDFIKKFEEEYSKYLDYVFSKL